MFGAENISDGWPADGDETLLAAFGVPVAGAG
jgi:hypothetical protein